MSRLVFSSCVIAIFEAEVAIPVKLAVIVPALKLPLLSLETNVLFVFKLVLPTIAIVILFELIAVFCDTAIDKLFELIAVLCVVVNVVLLELPKVSLNTVKLKY